MHDFIERITAYIHWAIFLLLEGLSGFLLFQYNHYQGSIWLTQANIVAAQVHKWEAHILSYLSMPTENAELTQRNIILQYDNDMLRHELAKLCTDSTNTQKALAKTLHGMTLIPAHIVNNSVRQKDNMLVIDAGSADGIQPEMGVVSGTGVVGIVSQVTPHYALVMSILNSHSSISCRLRDTEYFGYMKWKGGKTLRASMDEVPRHARIKKGDIVETSGFSNVFPPGIFLGKVAEIHNSSDGMAYELEILLSTDIANLRHVNVINNHSKEELDSLLAR
ncbi:MAG: rod shape-determining protein MreC [Prevotellaceae bacterium]|nr:rod shape-determining protein MreC [Prevotellaceae bacterium]